MANVFTHFHPKYSDQVRKYFADVSKDSKWANATNGEKHIFTLEFNIWLVGELKVALSRGININEMKFDFSMFKPSLFK